MNSCNICGRIYYSDADGYCVHEIDEDSVGFADLIMSARLVHNQKMSYALSRLISAYKTGTATKEELDFINQVKELK